MALNELPSDVVSFVRSHVQSVELLEVMLLLCRERDRAWDGDAVASELRIQPRSAITRLTALAKLGLVSSEPPAAHRFDATSPWCPVVEELGRLYQTHRVSIIELIFSTPRSSMEAFANAFVIGGKGKSDG